MTELFNTDVFLKFAAAFVAMVNPLYGIPIFLGMTRKNTPEERRRLGEAVASLRIDTKLSFTVDSLSLMRSRLTREGAFYSRLSSVALQSG